MPISKSKLTFSIFSTALAGGIITIYSKSNKTIPTKSEIKEIKVKAKLGVKYQKALIEEGNMWEYRFKDLKTGKAKNPKLLIAKNSNNDLGPWKVKEACEEIMNSDEDSEWFNDFQNFCVMKNKDDVNLINDTNRFDSIYAAFSKSNIDKLGKGFAEIWKNKGTNASEDWKQKMLNECKRLQEKMFMNDNEDSNFTNFCTFKK